MKRIRTATTILLISVITSLSAQDTGMPLSLEESCRLGIRRNVTVQNAELEQQKARYRLKETRSHLYPQLEAYSNFSYYYAIPKLIIPGEIFGQTGLIPVEIGTKFDWSSGLKATQILYNRSYFTSLQLARRMETLSELDLQQKKEEVIFQVSQLYYLCLATNEQIAQLNATIGNMERLLEIAKLQRDNDLIRKTDYSRILVNKNNLQTQADNLNELYARQLDLLKYVIGIPLETEVTLSDSLSFSSSAVFPVGILLEQPGLTDRTELRLLDKQIEMTALNRKMTRQSYLPTLSGFGQLYYQGQRNEFDFFKGGDDKFYKVGLVGISLSIPLFDGFEKRSKTKQYDLELMQLQNTREHALTGFLMEYTDARRQYYTSYTAMVRQQENIELAEETYDVSLQGYRQQVISLSDLLLSENSLTEARLSYYNALVQLKNAELEVKKAKGELRITNE